MAASVRSSSIANASSAGASWAIAMPAGAVAGDVVYVTIIMLNISSGRTANLTTEGFATLRNNDVMAGNTKTSLFRRVLDGSEDGTITGAFVGGGGNNWTAIAVCVEGADTTTPEDTTVVATIGATAVGNAQVCPDATAVGSDDLWLGMVAGNSNTGTYTWPTPPTELQDGGSTGRISMAWEALSASGACGTRTATSTSSNSTYSAYTILVKSAGVAVTPSAVAEVLAVQAPAAVTADAAPTPSAVAEVLAVQAPAAVSAGADVAVPAAVPMGLVVEAPTVLVGTVVQPAAVAMTMAPEAPAVAHDTAVAVPAAVPIALAVPAPTVGVGTELQPVPIVLAVQAPSISLGGSASPTAVPLVLTVQAPTIDVENGSLRIPGVNRGAATMAYSRFPLPPYDPTRTPPATVAGVPYRPGAENY